MKNFVSTKWLQNHLDDENIVIVDCRGDLLKDSYGEEVYRKGHIKKCCFCRFKKKLCLLKKWDMEVEIHYRM